MTKGHWEHTRDVGQHWANPNDVKGIFVSKLTSFNYYFFGQQNGEHLEHTKDVMQCWKHIEGCWGTIGKWQGVLGSI